MPLSEAELTFKRYLKGQLFNTQRPLTFDELETKANGFASLLFEDLQESQVNAVLQELTEENAVEMPAGDSIVDSTTFHKWIQERSSRVDTPRWNAYKQLLISRDWEASVIKTLDQQTDEVVELLGDPMNADGSWPRRGLLQGEVQSGKTATYLGILNKAIDYGYRIIIVIGGHTENLRQQTQARFDTDLIGIDSETWEDGISAAAMRRVGVGEHHELKSHLMTTVRHDFSRAKKGSSITFVGEEMPMIFITKKTPSILENIRHYIRSQFGGQQTDLPLIVVDDESDWGSPDTSTSIDPTSVNKAIRALLSVSSRASYLAITATPFANIFIDDQAEFDFMDPQARTDDDSTPVIRERLGDLFPSDYIRVMSPPNTYLGMAEYFTPGQKHRSIVTEVDDCLSLVPIKHKNNHPVPALPGSLKEATLAFLLGTSIRRLREQRVRPASMLVNVSRFKSVEASVADLLTDYLKETVNGITAELARETQDKGLTAKTLEQTWTKYYSGVNDVSWPQVAKELLAICHEFRVELVNGNTAKERATRRKLLTSKQRREDDLLPKIIVGGDILSRGLTLEGLQVSYFVREPRTMDTLMQMGRWFGYRPNFEDLVRIWMPESTLSDFEHSTLVTDELRDTLLDMKARELTPRDFGLRVRVHPDSVDVVARNKGRSSQIVDIGPTVWQNRLAECYELTGSEDVERRNVKAVQDLVDALGADNATPSSGKFHAWYGVSIDTIYDFFAAFRGAQNSQWFGRSTESAVPITEALDKAPGANNWTVCLVSGLPSSPTRSYSNLSIHMNSRNKMGLSTNGGSFILLDRRRVATGSDLLGALSLAEREELEGAFPVTHEGKRMSSQAATLASLRHPVLMIYTVIANEPSQPDDADLQPVAPGTTRTSVAIAFPKMSQDQVQDAAARSQKYRVNMVYWRAYHGYVEDEGDDAISSEF